MIDGSSEAVGSDEGRIQDAIRRSANTDKIQIGISPVSRNSAGVPVVRVQVEPSGNTIGRNSARVEIALAENAVVSTFARVKTTGANWTTWPSYEA